MQKLLILVLLWFTTILAGCIGWDTSQNMDILSANPQTICDMSMDKCESKSTLAAQNPVSLIWANKLRIQTTIPCGYEIYPKSAQKNDDGKIILTLWLDKILECASQPQLVNTEVELDWDIDKDLLTVLLKTPSWDEQIYP